MCTFGFFQIGLTLESSKWSNLPTPRVGSPSENFKNLAYKGYIHSHVRKSVRSPGYENNRRIESKYNHFLDGSLHFLKELAGNSFRVVQPTLENCLKTQRSWDEFNPGQYHTDEWYKRAFHFLRSSYGSVCKDCIASEEELSAYIDWAKSCGFPGNHLGYNSKRELVEDPVYQQWVEDFYYKIGTRQYVDPIIWTVSPKTEYKAYDDILNDKIRLFQIPPLHFLQLQLKYGKRISLRLKNFKWSAYGFNPFNGGTDKIAKALLTKKIRIYYDISGWDKFLPVLDDIYKFIDLETDKENWTEAEKNEFLFMVKNTIHPWMKFLSGEIYEKRYGNPSGSGTTTRDNIFAHVLILAAALIRAFHKKHGKFPTVQYLEEQIVFLFGDDSIMSLDDDFDSMLEPGFLEGHFATFGMKLKFIHGGYDYPLEKMQFLGFNFQLRDDQWYPKYDVVRLATSYIYDNPDGTSREAYISRAFMLTFMSYGNIEYYSKFIEAFCNIAKHYATFKDLTETERFFQSIANRISSVIVGLYNGFESEAAGFSFFDLQHRAHGLWVEQNSQWLSQESHELKN